MGDNFPNKVTTSLRLISMVTVTAQKNLTPSHAWEPRFMHSSLYSPNTQRVPLIIWE